MMIKTKRLSLRRVRSDDWKAIQTIWADAAASVYAQYDRPNALDDASVSHRVAKWAASADGEEQLAVAVCLQNAVIGYIVLFQKEYGYEMGYCFHSAYHGNGYAKESIAALFAAMKAKGVPRITAGTALQNTPSVRLLTALGFRLYETEKVSFYRDAAGNAVVFEGGNYELRLC